MNDTNNLAHTEWNCKYQILFALKYPVLLDGMNAALWNARRFEWDGTDIDRLV